MVRKRVEVVGFPIARGRRIRKNAGGVHTGVIQNDYRPRGVPLAAGFFRLMEDVTSASGAFWARRTDRLDSTDGEWTQVYNWDNILEGAVAGYHGLFISIDGEWVIDGGACVPDPCVHSGTLTVGDPPDGTVDVEYEGHTLTTITSVTGLSASGLPDGLSMDSSGEITGTPTEAGTFYVEITGVSGDDDCDVTRVMVLTVLPAEE